MCKKTLKAIKETLQKAAQQKSGERFKYAHHELKRVAGDHLLLKIIIGLIGVVFLIAGIIMLFIPGPGLLFIILGLMFLGFLALSVAHGLDQLELILKKAIDKWKERRSRK